MLDSDTDFLWDDPSIDTFVDDDTNCDCSDIVNSIGFTMVVLMLFTNIVPDMSSLSKEEKKGS